MLDPDKCPYHDDMHDDVKDIKAMVGRMDKQLSEGGVRINMVEKVAYGLIALVMSGFVFGLVGLLGWYFKKG
jgi:hypothetical protein